MVNDRPLSSAADGKLRKAFAVRRVMSADVPTRQAFAISHCRQTDQIGQPPRKHSCLPRGLFAVRCEWQRALCRRWQTAKSLHIVSFFCFFNPTIFTANIYDIYRYISQSYLTTHKFHRTYIYSSIHSYIASSIKIAKLHIHITMQSFIKIASSIVAS